MSIKQMLKKAMSDAVGTAVEFAQKYVRETRNVDMVLADTLRYVPGSAPVNDPVAYIEFLRTCIEPLAKKVVTTKESDAQNDVIGRRFLGLLKMLESEMPRIPFPSAIDITRAADRHRSSRTPIDLEHWSTDSGFLFEIAASLGLKGRIIASVIRACRPERCLELGTAHGMSAMFIMETLKQLGPSGNLVTVEGSERLHAIALRELTARYGDKVDCQLGMTGDLLPKLAKAIGPINFMFHDAAHSGDAYVSDFNAIVDALAPGAVILFDDIRWEHPQLQKPAVETYRGWTTIVGHPRIRHVAEVGGTMGLALLR